MFWFYNQFTLLTIHHLLILLGLLWSQDSQFNLSSCATDIHVKIIPVAVSSLSKGTPSAPMATCITPFSSSNQCRQVHIRKPQQKRPVHTRCWFQGEIVCQILQGLYFTNIYASGTSHPFINSVFWFFIFFPVSFTTSELFLMLAYFLLPMRPPSYSSRKRLTWFSLLLSAFILAFTVPAGIISHESVFSGGISIIYVPFCKIAIRPKLLPRKIYLQDFYIGGDSLDLLELESALN